MMLGLAIVAGCSVIGLCVCSGLYEVARSIDGLVGLFAEALHTLDEEHDVTH